MEPLELDLVIDSQLAAVLPAAAAVFELCERIPLPREEAERIRACVIEGLNNSVLHGYDTRPGGRIEVHVETRPTDLSIEIRDRGRPLEIPESAAPPALLDGDLDEMDEGGRGLLIMRAWMDGVTLQRAGDWNVLRLSKRLTGSASS
jgi:stage II sporulation protein AB (anti-sigma F factor)